MSQSEVREVEEGKVSKKRRFDSRDWSVISDFVKDTLDTRKRERKDLEKAWKEIDRQVAMKPEISHKLNADGTPNMDKAWMPELELPLQAQTLEMLTADARRMMFPDSGPWYQAHAALTDDYLDRVDFQSLIAGDRNEVPTRIDQDAADKLTAGIIDHWHRQYDFFGHIDQINAEAFSYGMGLGRARLVNKRVFLHTAKGVVNLNQRIPILVPVSIRNTYIDDSQHRLMNEGHWVGPSVVREWRQLFSDIALAASKGSKDPENENGGWMPKNLSGMGPEKDDGTVQVIEMEGDFIVPRKTTGDLYIPNAIATVVTGRKGKNPHKQVIRFRFRETGGSSFIQFPYHVEKLDTAYPSSPLLKGRPIQKTAVDALSRMIEAAALNTQPPLQYDKDDTTFALQGGPKIKPGANFATTGDVTPLFIGDPSSLFQIYIGLLQQYADVTGINAPRLGAQTVSHTTAFAKEAELQRGTIRTIDYVRSTLKGAMTQWLDMAYTMGRKNVNEMSMYIDSYNGWVEIDKQKLPDDVTFEVHGAGGPQEEAAQQQQRLQSMQLALQLDTTAAQMGVEPSLLQNMPQVIDHVLRQGGWTDVDVLLQAAQQTDVEGAPGPLAGIVSQQVQQ